MRATVCVLMAWFACAAFGCGAGQRSQDSANSGPQEFTLGTVAIHPSDTEAPEAPPSGPPLEQAVLHAIDARHAAVAQCYATALRQAPDAVGRITVDIVFAPDGHVDRVNGHIEGEGGIGTARVCVESALRGAVVQATSTSAVRVHRSYTFANPPVEITLAAPIPVTPPPRGHHGASVSAAPEGSQPASAPADATSGPLSDDEVSAALNARETELQQCYRAALHADRGATGTAAITIDVAGTGTVSNVRFESGVPALASANDCVSNAIRETHFRVSGTGATVHANLDFHR